MKQSLKRKFKRLIDKENRTKKSLASNTTTGIIIVVIALVIFGISQITINSILSPLGAQLESLNQEKDQLVEENHRLEQQIAETNSLTIIKDYSDKKLGLKDEYSREMIYITDDTIRAEK